MSTIAASPLERSLLERIARTHSVPAVTLLIPLEHERPGNREDPRRLAAMRAGVLDRLEGVWAPGADAVAERLDAALARIDLDHPIPGVVVLVAPDTSSVLHLGHTPRSTVVVGREFAFAAVLEALQHEVRARALLLSRGESRCVDIDDSRAVEREDHGFPVAAVVRGSIGNPHEDLPAGERVLAEDALVTFRAVWSSTVALQRDDPRELVLIGTPRDLATMDAVRGSEVPIAARVPAAHEWDRVAEIGDLATAKLAEQHGAAMLDLCARAEAALGHGVVDGLGGVWSAAREGRGHRLLVEQGLRHPMRARADGELGPLEPHLAEDPEHLDAVDATIGAVLAHGGDAVVVPEGALARLGGIALTMRG